MESGLSLAQLGKGHVTAPAIYLVETGRTRPSMPTLEHIARRTNKPVEFFLADPEGAADETHSALIELELLVAGGRNQDAITLGEKLMEVGTSAHRLGRVRLLLGQAHAQLAHFDTAERLLGEARAHFEAVHDDVMVVDSLAALAMVASRTHSTSVVSLAEEALILCRALTPVPTPVEARLLEILATALVANRDLDRAVVYYEEAIERAGTALELKVSAEMHSGLSRAYRESGQVEAANRYAMRAVALFQLAADRAAMATSEQNLGLIARTRGEAEAAQAHFDRSRELAARMGGTLAGPSGQVLLSLSELSLQRDNARQAMEFGLQAQETARTAGDPATAAEAHMWIGLAAEKLGDAGLADREFEAALRALAELGPKELLLQCHGAYAEVLERRGDLNKAYIHMKQAVLAGRPDLLAHTESEERSGAV